MIHRILQCRYFHSICVCALLICLASTAASADQVVRFDTVLGNFHVQLFDSVTPLTVANFMNYVNDGDYVNTFFHRLVDGFVLQGGGYTFDIETDAFALVPEDSPVDNEFNISNTYGTIAMAKLGTDPNSATSEFFVNLGDNSENLDNQNGGFTVFGEVIGNGMDVVELLASQTVWNATQVSPWDTLPLIDYDPVGGVPWYNCLEMIYNIVPATPGDCDADGDVDLNDFLILKNNFSTPSDWSTGDFDGDGMVGLDDFIILKGNFTGQDAAVPEPASATLVLLGLTFLTRRVRKQ